MVIVFALLGVGCGYRSTHDSATTPPRIGVRVVTSTVDASATLSAQNAVQQALARAGRYDPSATALLEVQISRVERQTTGISLVSGEPTGRGLLLRLTGNAKLVYSARPSDQVDIGDVSVETIVRTAGSAAEQIQAEDEATRWLADRFGQVVVERLVSP